MYSVKIRDHIMIAHSLNDAFFGPARKLHGATYIVDITFYSKELDKHNVVIDIAFAQQSLSRVLDPLKFTNLDEFLPFEDKLTTTEFLARYIHDKVQEETSGIFTGKIKVTLGESHVAWASYED
jgi:6-pyruvoyltetrahydropterin/6-carboxytetrahydropterin synthase